MVDIRTLRDLGFTDYESRIMLALLEGGPATVRTIISHSKVPKNKAYDMLKKLQEKNIVEVLPLTPRHYNIGSLQPIHEYIAQKQLRLDAAKAAVQDMTNAKSVHEYKDFFWVIMGKRHIQQRVIEENNQAKQEILIVHRLTSRVPNNVRSIKQARVRGVTVKIICPLTQENKKNVQLWKSSGAEIRVCDKQTFTTMPRYAIFDMTTVRITIGSPDVQDEEQYLSMRADSPTLAAFFRPHFYALWVKLKPLRT